MPRPVHIRLHEHLEQALDAIADDFPTLKQDLIADFRAYVASEGSLIPDNFGRDSIFNEPYLAQRARLRHIHVCLPPDTFDPNRTQSDRTNSADDPKRDAFLVYVRHEFYEERYLLIDFMFPDAHGVARDHEVMRRLGYIAQAFQNE